MSEVKTINLLREQCRKPKGQDSAEFEYLDCEVAIFGKVHKLVAVRAKPTGNRQPADEYLVPWILDSESPNCMRCNCAFTFITNRRHHCRVCGYLVCKSCTKEFRVIASLEHDESGSRICSFCSQQGSNHTNRQNTNNTTGTTWQESTVDDNFSQELAPAPSDSAPADSKPLSKTTKPETSSPNDGPTAPTTTTNPTDMKSSSVVDETETRVTKQQLNVAEFDSLSARILAAEQAGESRRHELADLKQQRLAQFLSISNYEQCEQYQVLSNAERAELHQMAKEQKKRQLEQQKQANLAAFLNTHDESSSLTVKDRAEMVSLAQRERQLQLEKEKQARLSSFLSTSSSNDTPCTPGNITQRFEEARLRQQQEEQERIERLKRDPTRSIRISASASQEDDDGDKTLLPAVVLTSVMLQQEGGVDAKNAANKHEQAEVHTTNHSTTTMTPGKDDNIMNESSMLSSEPQTPLATPDLTRLGATGDELDHRLAQVMSQSMWMAADSPDGGESVAASSSTQSTPFFAQPGNHIVENNNRLPTINEPPVVVGTDLNLDEEVHEQGEEEDEDGDEDGNRLSNLDYLSTHSQSQSTMTRPKSERRIIGSGGEEEEVGVEHEDEEDEETKKRRVSTRGMTITPPPHKRRSLSKNEDTNLQQGDETGEPKEGDSFFDSPFVLATTSNASQEVEALQHPQVAEIVIAETEEEKVVQDEEEPELERESEIEAPEAQGNGKAGNGKARKNRNKRIRIRSK